MVLCRLFKGTGVIFDVFKNYKKSLSKSQGLKENININFSLEKQTEVLKGILDKYVKVIKPMELKLPEIKKL